MTEQAKNAIDKMTSEEQLRKAASVHYKDKELVAYIDKRLDHLNVDNALVEYTDLDDFGDF